MKKRPGYTLIELLTVMAIAGVLIALAWPGMATLRQTADQKDSLDQFVSILRQAQAKAIAGQGNADHIVTFSASSPACAYAASPLGSFTAPNGITCYKHNTTNTPDTLTFKKLTGLVTTGSGQIDFGTKTVMVSSVGVISVL